VVAAVAEEVVQVWRTLCQISVERVVAVVGVVGVAVVGVAVVLLLMMLC